MAIFLASSLVSPPSGCISSALRRTPRVKSGPTVFRTASITSQGRSACGFRGFRRKASVLKLVAGRQKLSNEGAVPQLELDAVKSPFHHMECTSSGKYSMHSFMSSISISLDHSRNRGSFPGRRAPTREGGRVCRPPACRCGLTGRRFWCHIRECSDVSFRKPGITSGTKASTSLAYARSDG